MGNWIEINPNELIPADLIKSFEGGNTVYKQYLQFTQEAINATRAVQKLLTTPPPDVLQLVTKTITAAVRGLLQSGKIHILFIPMGKIYPVTVNKGLPSTYNDMGEYFGATPEDMAKNVDPNAAAAYEQAIAEGGGNAGFLQTFTSSLMDELDPNRPQYLRPDDAVIMLVVLAGSPTFDGAINAASGLNRIFQPKGNNDLAARTLPIPTGLRVKTIGIPTETLIGVRLDWELPATSTTSPFFPGVFTSVKRYAVIRSTSDRIVAARTVLDLFPTQSLTKGLESTDSEKSHKVIEISSARTSTCIDNSELDATKTYYYTLAWELNITENGITTTLPFDKLSSIVKTQPRITTPTQNAVPPDWIASPAPLDLIPGLAQQTMILLERLEVLSTRSIGIPALLNTSLDLLTQNIEKGIKRIDEITRQIGLLSVAFSQPFPQLYSTFISGVGGNAKLIADLALRLSDPTDDSRPPFDGGEYTMGICAVAGGPRLPDLKPISDLLNSLFQSPQATSPLVSVLDDIEATVAATEAIVFGEDLQPLPINEDGTITTPTGNVLPSEIDPLTGLVKTPYRPIIGEDGQALESMDPGNPVAGNPNPCS